MAAEESGVKLTSEVASEEGKTGNFVCNQCQKRYHTMNALNSHMKAHQDGKPLYCEYCCKYFSKRNNFKVHMKIHTKERPFTCSICNKSFTLKNYLRAHMQVHTGEKPFTCNICSQGFSRKAYFNIHMRRHSGEGAYECPICNKSSFYKHHFASHLQTHAGHSPVKYKKKECRFKCDICPKAFPSKSKLAKHMNWHNGEKHYVCLVCKRAYRNKSNLDVHILTHTGEKMHQCPFCMKTFALKGNLLKHMKIHLKIENVATNNEDDIVDNLDICLQESSIELPPDIDTFSDHSNAEECMICHEVFSMRESFEDHLRTHVTEDSLFGYDACDDSSIPDSILDYADMQVKECHDCIVCRKTFPTRDILQEHLHIHVKEIEFSSYNNTQLEDNIINSLMDSNDFLSIPEDCIYNCVICCEPFESKEDLQKHSESHTILESVLNQNIPFC